MFATKVFLGFTLVLLLGYAIEDVGEYFNRQNAIKIRGKQFAQLFY